MEYIVDEQVDVDSWPTRDKENMGERSCYFEEKIIYKTTQTKGWSRKASPAN
jgi:hypothetical protein